MQGLSHCFSTVSRKRVAPFVTLPPKFFFFDACEEDVFLDLDLARGSKVRL